MSETVPIVISSPSQSCKNQDDTRNTISSTSATSSEAANHQQSNDDIIEITDEVDDSDRNHGTQARNIIGESDKAIKTQVIRRSCLLLNKHNILH